jgi:hypothetical protein
VRQQIITLGQLPAWPWRISGCIDHVLVARARRFGRCRRCSFVVATCISQARPRTSPAPSAAEVAGASVVLQPMRRCRCHGHAAHGVFQGAVWGESGVAPCGPLVRVALVAVACGRVHRGDPGLTRRILRPGVAGSRTCLPLPLARRAARQWLSKTRNDRPCQRVTVERALRLTGKYARTLLDMSLAFGRVLFAGYSGELQQARF